LNKIGAVIGYTLREHARHKVFLLIWIFAALMIAGSLVVSSLAGEERLRMLLDIGLAGIEFIALIAVVFVAVQLVQEEVESRAIYLMLSRPLPRWSYITGRFLGTLVAIVGGMAIMGLLHSALLGFYGWTAYGTYATAWLCAVGKIAVVGSLALFLSLATTSMASAMIFTLFLWLLGHFTGELEFMAERTGTLPVQAIAWTARKVTPDFSLFNYRDFLDAAVVPGGAWFAQLAVYTLLYVGATLFLATWIFEKREF
jgi:ABC-2 type transport system permease protein